MRTRYMFVAVALLALVVPAVAQTPTTAPTVSSITNLGYWDVNTQSLISPPPGTPTLVYDNSVTNGSLFPPGPGIAVMDWGTLSAAPNNDITEIVIGYATSSLVPVDLNIYLHAGATGFGDAGSTISGIGLTGLPPSASGGFEGFIITVTGFGTITLPDGPIGYSYEALDAVTGPLTIGPPNEAGVIDAFDQYATPTFTYLSTNFFGGAPFASFFIQLLGEEPAECFLVIGDDPGSSPYIGQNHLFNTQVGPAVLEDHEVLMDDIPQFVLPIQTRQSFLGWGGKKGSPPSVVPGGLGDIPAETPSWMYDMNFSVQVLMWNPEVFPQLPEQYTPGLNVSLLPNGGVTSTQYGTTVGGLDIWHKIGKNSEGQRVISFPFFVPGL